MRKLSGLLLAAGVLGMTSSAFAFGKEGHEAIGILAVQKLHADASANNPKATVALQNIVKLLGNEDLAAVAKWADCIRLPIIGCAASGEIHDINTRFAGNGSWHFVDLPLGTTAYSASAVSASDNDVVQGINKCIAFLETADSSPQKDHHAVALKFLVHLVGDIHQPLHVACGYYQLNKSKIIRAPGKAKGAPNDRGANHLLSKANTNSASLHHIWDSDLVFAQTSIAADKVEGTDVATALSTDLTANLFPAATGDHHDWAAVWAKDSIKASRAAYKGIKVPPIAALVDGGNEITNTTMKNFSKSSYVAAHESGAKQQLLKASWRLAELLENINWHD